MDAINVIEIALSIAGIAMSAAALVMIARMRKR